MDSEALARRDESKVLDGWIVPPNTPSRRKRDPRSGRRTEAMAQPLMELVEQFCTYQRKQKDRTEDGVWRATGHLVSCHLSRARPVAPTRRKGF